MRPVDDTLRQALAHVLWIGGAPDSGKTTLAAQLGERHGLPVYHFDRHEMAHFGRLDPARHPALYRLHPERMTTEERWLGSAPEALARDALECWSERCDMALDDLLALSSDQPVIAEGPGFFPECVAPLLSDRRQAIWLVPAEAFKRESVARRGKPSNRHETSDPARATANLIARDLLLAAHVQRRAAELDLPVIVVDGAQSLDEVAALVAARFAPWLVGTGAGAAP